MSHSSAAIASYVHGGKECEHKVYFEGGLPGKGDTFIMHGQGMNYLYDVLRVIWHGYPEPELDGDRAIPTIRLGQCIDRWPTGLERGSQ